MKTFSVIMPIYGVERYLRQGVDSVLAQSFEDYEIILVDDCSPDSCPSICDEYAEKDERIRVIHKPQNEGLGEARNTGFRAAEGEYILYMDSDDTIEADLLQLVNNAIKSDRDADIVVFGSRCVHENKSGEAYYQEDLRPEARVAKAKEEIGECFIELSSKRIFPYAWNKVYKRSFLEKTGVVFERTKLIEDFLYNITLFRQASKVCILSEVLYNYRKPAHQTLASAYSPMFFSLTKRKFALEMDFLKEMGIAGEENRQFVLYNHLKHIISTFIRNSSARAGLKGKEQKNLIKEILSDADTKLVLSDYKPRRLHMKFICAVLKTGSPTMCWLLAKAIDFAKNSLWIRSKEG